MNIQNRANLEPATEITQRTPSESLLLSETNGARLSRIPLTWIAPVSPRTIGLREPSLPRPIDHPTRSEDRARTIIDAIPAIAWCTLSDGSGESWNQRWYEYTGLSPQAARGWGWYAVVHPDDLHDLTHK